MARQIAVLGAGNLGGALLDAWCRADFDQSLSVVVIDPAMERSDSSIDSSIERSDSATERSDSATERSGNWQGISATINPKAGIAGCDYIVVAVKPQIVRDVLEPLREKFNSETCVISVVAGLGMLDLAALTHPQSPLVRVMPNTPAKVGAGMSALHYSSRVNDEQRSFVRSLFLACGDITEVGDESDFDAITAVSGSGPAYLFHFVECLTDAAQASGLSRHMSEKLARQTVIGAARLLEQSDASASCLRAEVTSPGGTTEAGLTALMESGALARLMSETVSRARKRSEQL